MIEVGDYICWNGMTEVQQAHVAQWGSPDPEDYGGGSCPNRAEVEVGELGTMPGPRFYCVPCAIELVQQVAKTERLVVGSLPRRTVLRLSLATEGV